MKRLLFLIPVAIAISLIFVSIRLRSPYVTGKWLAYPFGSYVYSDEQIRDLPAEPAKIPGMRMMYGVISERNLVSGESSQQFIAGQTQFFKANLPGAGKGWIADPGDTTRQWSCSLWSRVGNDLFYSLKLYNGERAFFLWRYQDGKWQMPDYKEYLAKFTDLSFLDSLLELSQVDALLTKLIYGQPDNPCYWAGTNQ